MLKKPVVFLLCMLSLSGFAQQKTSLQKGENNIQIPFELTEYNNLLMQVVLNHKDSLKLMFHSAADAVNLTEEATNRVKLDYSRTDSVKSWGGNNNTSRYSENNQLQMGPLHFDKLSIWEDKNSGQHSDGKFGMNLFDGHVVAIDFEKKILTLSETLPTDIASYTKHKLIAENGYLFLAANSVIGKEIIPNKYLIHSGYAGAILYDDEFVSKHQISEKIKITHEKELKDSFGNVLKTQKGIISKFSIDEIDLSQVPVGFFSGALSRQKMSILGGDMLKRFQIVYDLERSHIYLKANQLAKLDYSNF